MTFDLPRSITFHRLLGYREQYETGTVSI
jgi:hypothetical protein